jgi:sarcosine oxidase subunit beta
MEPEGADVVVLGAGIAGCALAYHLAGRHVEPVIVVDPRTPAAGASGRAAGVVTEQLWNEWDVAVVRDSHKEYAALCRRWAPEAYRRNGFVRWTHRSDAAQVLREAHDRLKGWGVRTTLREGEELATRLPEVAFGPGAVGLDSPNDACVNPTALTGVYAEGARRQGVRFELGAPVESVTTEAERWIVRTAVHAFRARRLVVAAGAWSKALLRQVGHPLPLAPYRTQAALLRPSKPARGELPTGHDIDTDVYLRPEDHGRILAGDGTENVEADPERFVTGGDPAFVARLAEVIEARWPRFADADVAASWAGVCTATRDRRPIIGAVPGAPGLFVLTGFNGFGVMRGGGAARRLAIYLTEEDGSAEGRALLGPVRPDRFDGPIRSFRPRPGFTLEAGDDPRF